MKIEASRDRYLSVGQRNLKSKSGPFITENELYLVKSWLCWEVPKRYEMLYQRHNLFPCGI